MSKNYEKNMKKIINFLVILLLLDFTNCKKFLDEHPKSIASPQTILTSVAGLDAAVIGAYSNITGWSKM